MNQHSTSIQLLNQAYQALLSGEALETFYHENALLVGQDRTHFLSEQRAWFELNLKPKLKNRNIHTEIYQPDEHTTPFFRVFHNDILLAEEQFIFSDNQIFKTLAPIDCFGKLIFDNRKAQPQRALTLNVAPGNSIENILFLAQDVEDVEFSEGTSFAEDRFYSCTFNLENDNFNTVIRKIRLDGHTGNIPFTYKFDIVCRGLDFPYFKATQAPLLEGFLLHLRHNPTYYYSIKMKEGGYDYTTEYYTSDLIGMDNRLFLKKEITEIDLIVDGPAFEYHLFTDV